MNLVQTSIRIVAAAALAGAAATVVVATRAGPAPIAGPARPALQTIELGGTGFRTVALTATDPGQAGHAIKPFALLGATWSDPRAALGVSVEVRTQALAGHRWSAWRTLAVDEPTAADPGSPGRGGTDPIWVGDSDGVQTRIVGAAPIPAGLRLDLINPDSGEPLLVPSAYRQPAAIRSIGRGQARYQPRPAPNLVSRTGWGANESIVLKRPAYTTDVQVLFVHHTADPGAYNCADSPRIVRGIEAYHVRSKGWNDIGYNFLVDKCGKLFEGRRGGETRPVLGAHTLGFNQRSAAIAVIGDYRNTGVSATVENVIAQVAAYKIGMYGNLASGRTTLVSTGSDRYAEGATAALNRISGHRDTGRTECPGDALYAQLPAIRAIAAAGPAHLRLSKLTGAVRSGRGYFYTKGTIRPLWTTSTPSGLMNRFDVSVDGRLVVSAPRSHRTTTLNLGPGKRVLTIRAVHLSGRTASTTVTVYSGRRPPR
ncbi:MAG: hypothetical protein QOC94_3380 [Actinoplanes sp.]|nr:hypothetical protein [Actinoplanes sp.]